MITGPWKMLVTPQNLGLQTLELSSARNAQPAFDDNALFRRELHNGVTISIALKAVALTRLIRLIYSKRYFRHIRSVVIHEFRPLMTLWYIKDNHAV